MRRNMCLSILAILLLTGCEDYSFQIKKDEFKNSTTITMEMEHNIPDWSSISFTTTGTKYYREVKEGKTAKTVISFYFRTEHEEVVEKYNKLQETVHFKIDKKVHKLKLKNVKTNKKLNIGAVKDDDSDDVSISTDLSKFWSAKLVLTKNIENEIIKSNSLKYRFYLEEDPITLEVTPEQLDAIRRFLKATWEDQNIENLRKSKMTEAIFKKPHSSIGFKAGVGVSFFGGNKWTDRLEYWDALNVNKVSFVVGFFADIELLRKGVFGLSLQPELLFNKHGGGLSQGVNTENSWKSYTYYADNYGIKIPIYVKPKFKVGRGDIFLKIGIDHFFRIQGKTKIWESGSIPEKHTLPPQLNFDILLGVGTGIGYDLLLGPGKLSIGITYTNYFKSYYGNEAYNNDLSFDIGYAFIIKKG